VPKRRLLAICGHRSLVGVAVQRVRTTPPNR